jgi:transcriptional regulator with XRE-family HTH domain
MAETLGSLLRKKRESLGLTLEKVEGFTHIRVKHLQAIESDDLSSIPSVPQARGFIRNYAAFLDVNPEQAVANAVPSKSKPVQPPAAGAQSDETPPPPAPKEKTATPVSATQPRPPITAPVISRSADYAKPRAGAAGSPVRRWLRLDWILGGAVTLVILGFLGWGGYYAVLSMTGTATSTATVSFIPLGPAGATPSREALLTGAIGPMLTTSGTAPAGTNAADSTAGGPTEDATFSQTVLALGTISIPTPLPTAIPTPLGGVYTDVRIHIVVLQRAYLEVVVDGKTASSGRVLPEETFDYVGKQTVAITTGNGAGIRVIFNGVDEGAMGRFGELVTRTYTPAGAITPVPEPTITPTVTATPTPTKNP